MPPSFLAQNRNSEQKASESKQTKAQGSTEHGRIITWLISAWKANVSTLVSAMAVQWLGQRKPRLAVDFYARWDTCGSAKVKKSTERDQI
jgi:hypothetical protein